MDRRYTELKSVLEKLYTRYNRRTFIPPDPLQFVYRYSNRQDMETAAFLAAELAYGNVKQIEKSLNKLLGLMGKSPFEFVIYFDGRKRKKLWNFKHRFTTGKDLADLIALLKKILIEFGSIEKFFAQGYRPDDKNIVSALSKFCDSLLGMYATTHKGFIPKNLRFLLPRPSDGSPCKRLNLFLRWMIRRDNVDVGLWKAFDMSKLVVPVDVHMARLCRILKMYSRKTISLATAVEITNNFQQLTPDDPVKYDFALSRIGILDNCTGRHRSNCQSCELFRFCFCT